MSKTLIQKHSSSMIRGLSERVRALSDLDHRLTKGELRELFISGILASFLTSQFDIGTGIVINQAGKQSKQADIIIYDNRILPPFIKEQHIGVFPAESVLAIIEVKSRLTKAELLHTEEAAQYLYQVVYHPDYSIYEDFEAFTPSYAVIGFYGTGVRELSKKDEGKEWIEQNIRVLTGICLMNKYSWMNITDVGWVMGKHDPITHGEVKRFAAIILDTIRTWSQQRLQRMSQYHRDWLGLYIRDQDIFKS